MGVERFIRIADSAPVDWPAIRSRLVALGEVPAMRMIDSELAFPEEEPSAPWRELRIALRGGMVTLRLAPDGIACITWGNADSALQRSWDSVAWAVAAATDGQILNGSQSLSADEFARSVGIAPV